MSFFLYLGLVFLAIGLGILAWTLLKRRSRKAGNRAGNQHA